MTLNIKLILNQKFDEACKKIYSPRNAFCISRDEGMMNQDVNVFKDTLINFSAFLSINKKNYTKDQLEKINYVKNKYKDTL